MNWQNAVRHSMVMLSLHTLLDLAYESTDTTVLTQKTYSKTFAVVYSPLIGKALKIKHAPTSI